MSLPIRLLTEHPHILIDPCAEMASPLHGLVGTHIRHPKLNLPDEFLPRVMDARQLDDAQRAECFDHLESLQQAGRSGEMVGVLSSPAESSEVAEHLALQSVRQLADLGRHWVRVWDAQVLMHLLWIWPGEELRRLFGPIERWVLILPAEVMTVARAELSGSGLARSAERHRALMDIGIINSALAGLPWRFADVARLGPRMLDAIQRARVKHRLYDEADLALFAQQACKWGERFTEHPDLMAALAMTQDGETRYCDALMQIDDSRMQRIDAELSV